MSRPALWLIILLFALYAPCSGADVSGPAVTEPTNPIRVTGMFSTDWACFFNEEEVGRALTGGDSEAPDPFVDGTEFRRSRLGVEGELSANLELKLEYDLASGQAQPADVYLGITGIPLIGAVRVGHQYEPLSRLTGSSKYLVFLEKALPTALSPGRNTGVRTLSDWFQKRMTFSAGAFRETDLTGANGANHGYSFTARLTGLPVFQDSGRRLGHLGVAYSRRDPRGDAIRFRQRPEAHLAPYVVDTQAMHASSVDVVALEAAAVVGPASLQGEYLQATLDERDAGDVRFFGYYVTAGWVLTGEHRPYSRTNGAFTQFVPRRDFDLESGAYGAWMLLVRYSHIDLQDRTVEGGVLTDLSFGLNWYLNANTRITWDYILADAGEMGDLGIAQMRVQVGL
jgi:phosphate-selective porin OprO and OprP